MYTRQLLETMGNNLTEPTTIYEDNQACVQIASTSKVNDRSKHIELRFHSTREMIANEEIKIEYRLTSEMIADIFTKPLGRAKFEGFRADMGLELYSPNTSRDQSQGSDKGYLGVSIVDKGYLGVSTVGCNNGRKETNIYEVLAEQDQLIDELMNGNESNEEAVYWSKSKYYSGRVNKYLRDSFRT